MGLDVYLEARSKTDPDYRYDIAYARKCWGLYFGLKSLIEEEDLLPTDSLYTVNFKNVEPLEDFAKAVMQYKQQLLDCIDLIEKARYANWDSEEQTAADHAIVELLSIFTDPNFLLNQTIEEDDVTDCSLGEEWFVSTLYAWLNDISIFLYKYNQLPDKVKDNLYFTLIASF